MGSTYSNLKVQLMTTGENTTTWGNVTNLNLGTALEEAIVNTGTVTFASNNQTLSLTDTNASQTARRMRLLCTGTTGGSTRNLVVPSIEKPYIVQNDCADSILVKTSGGTGITVPTGKTTWVYCNGTNVVDVITHLTSLSFGGNLTVTGNSSVSGNSTVSGTLAVTGNVTASANVAVTGSLAVSTNANVTGNLAVTGNATVTGNTTISGSLSVASINDGTNVATSGTVTSTTVGYRGLPQNSKTTSYTLAASDNGKHVSTTATVNVPLNASVSLVTGFATVIYNGGGSSISIVPAGGVTLYLGGTTTSGTRTLGRNGVASLLKVGTDTWICSGAGVL